MSTENKKWFGPVMFLLMAIVAFLIYLLISHWMAEAKKDYEFQKQEQEQERRDRE